ncbi:MAG: glucose-1-phosphate thymidylyltransferase RfbA [Nitrospirae bacterium]|nr:glucose-1-phosphate thymidylyltransferase RfbA [Nitrospirota bacterium]
MRGIILAGGSGTRLWPVTKGCSKQLLPVYDKPMIYYPLSTLMLMGIQDILIITTPHDQAAFQALLGDGHQFGMSLSYAIQPRPEGIAQAFIIGAEFIGNSAVALILGDNIFYGARLIESLREGMNRQSGATVFSYQVRDPQRYGVVEFDEAGQALSLEEKPVKPRSSHVVTGLYIYDNQVVEIASSLKPSARNELEITDVNNTYLHEKRLFVNKLGRGIAWLDTGTPESLLQAATFIQTIQERQGLMVACLEEIGLTQGYISREQVKQAAESMKGNDYGQYLIRLLQVGT